MWCLFRRGTKKAAKPKTTSRKPAKPAAKRKTATPAPHGAVRKPRQTARPKPATAPA